MICHIAATVGLFKRDAGTGQDLRRRQQIFAMRIAPHGHNMRMLGEEELIANHAGFQIRDTLLLNSESRTPAKEAQIANLKRTAQALMASP